MNTLDLLQTNLEAAELAIVDRSKRIKSLQHDLAKNVVALYDAENGNHSRLSIERIATKQELENLVDELQEANRRRSLAARAIYEHRLDAAREVYELAEGEARATRKAFLAAQDALMHFRNSGGRGGGLLTSEKAAELARLEVAIATSKAANEISQNEARRAGADLQAVKAEGQELETSKT